MRLISRRALVSLLVALVGVVSWAGAELVARQRALAGMATAATAFVSSLTPDQRQKAVFPMPTDACLQATDASGCEWTKWAFIPASMAPRNGLPIKDMTPAQRERAQELMRASLSQVGYTTANAIMNLERVLRITENADETGRSGGQPVAPYVNTPPAPTMGAACGLGDLSGIAPAAGAGGGRRGGGGGGGGQAAGGGQPAAGGGQAAAGGAQPAAGGGGQGGGARAGGGGGRGGGGGAPIIRDPELYYFSVFGEPSAKGKWGWRVEGHHLSFRFGIDAGKATVSTTPQFLGANPARVPDGLPGSGLPTAGLRTLAVQEDTARALVQSLNPTQCTAVLTAGSPLGDASTGTRLKIDPATPVGLSAAQMTAPQRDMLMKVIDSYAAVMPADIAADRLAKIKAAGIEKLSFAWQGSSEPRQRYHYVIQGPTFLIEHNNTQNNGNHIHSVWRDFNGDFGRDLLGEHMAAAH